MLDRVAFRASLRLRRQAQVGAHGAVALGKAAGDFGFVYVAPADDAAVSMIVIVDEPTLSREEGSMIAAPYNSKIMSEVLPYLGYLPSYSDKDEQYKSTTVDNYEGMNT